MTEAAPSNVKVFVRLRPPVEQDDSAAVHIVEQLTETSCRVHGSDHDPFEFDGIISSSSSQSNDVYEQSCQHLPQHLCDGHHVTLVAYGASHSGKTATLVDDEHGILRPLVRSVFGQLRSQPPAECTIQCSVAELYLESVRDLLGQRPRRDDDNDDDDNDAPRIHHGALVGCTALSCISEDDVLQVVRRAQTMRTAAHDNPQRHSSKSTLVVQLAVQTVAANGTERRLGRLLVVDCAPSNYAGDDGGIIESQPMQALHAYVRERIETQQSTNGPSLSRENVRKLPLIAQLLLYSLGANCVTSVIVCVNNQQRSTAASLAALQFGRDCRRLRNHARPNVHHAWQDCVDFQAQAADRLEQLETVVRALANECVRLRSKGGSFLVQNKQLWSMIDEITASATDRRPIDFTVETKTDHEHKVELMKWRSELRRSDDERDKASARAAKAKADLQVMKEQTVTLDNQYREQKVELEQVRSENAALKHRKTDVELNLRTSLFRESEAVVFLRQFRKFYSRLLHKMAKEGSGDVSSIIRNIPGAPDMTGMVDLDRMMVESGLLEEEEIGKDNAPKDYRPSRTALQRSSKALADAEKILENETNGLHSPGGVAGVNLSIVTRLETGEMTEARQRLFQTPSGRYIAMRERELEAELLQLSEKCITLQSLLDDEKANISALAVTDTSASILRAAHELKAVQDKLKKKEKDWQAVILKMNELHLSSKDARDKVDNRDQHVIHLESTLAESQRVHAHHLAKMQASDDSLRIECDELRKQVNGQSVALWQYAEPGTDLPTLSSRVIVPFFTGTEVLLSDAVKRQSCKEQDLWIDLYFTPKVVLSAPIISVAHSSTDKVPSLAVENETSVSNGIDSLLFMDDEEATHLDPAQHNESSAFIDDSLIASNLVRAYGNTSVSVNVPPVQGAAKNATANNGRNIIDPDPSIPVDPILPKPPLHTPSTESRPVPPDVTEPTLKDKPKPPTNSIMERLKAKAEAAASRDKSEDDGVPEWMRKFKKIGAKNANEAVLETQGAAGVREFGRTPWEALKLHDRKATPAADLFSQQKVKWTPRVKNGSDSDSDDVDRRPVFSRYAGEIPIAAPSIDNSDEENEKEGPKSGYIAIARDDEVRASLPPVHPRQGSDSDSDSSDEDIKQVSRSTHPVAPVSKPQSDSDSNDDEVEPAKSGVSEAVNENSKLVHDSRLSPPKKDSGSDSDSSEEFQRKPTLVPVSARTSAKKASDSDSDSSDDSPRKLSVAPPPAPTVSASTDFAKATASFTAKPLPAKKESDSDSDSSTDSKPKTPQAPLRPDVPTKKDSDSDSDSSEDSSRNKPTVARVLPPKKPAAIRKGSDSDSDTDSSEDSSRNKPTAARISPPAKPVALIKKGSDSDSDSSDDVSKRKTTTAGQVPLPTKSAAAARKGSDSDSDSDSSDDSRRNQPTAARTAPPAKPTTDSDSDESDSSEDSTPKSTPSAKASAPLTKKNDSDSDSDSSEETKPVKTTAVPQPVKPSAKQDEDDGFGGWSKPAQKSIADDNDSDSDSDDNHANAPRMSPARTSSNTLTRSVLTKKAPVSDSATATAKDKQMFVIVNGKLVKSKSKSDLVATDNTAGGDVKPRKPKASSKKPQSPKKTAAPSFVIVDGKLVKTDGGVDKKGGKKKAGEAKKKKKK